MSNILIVLSSNFLFDLLGSPVLRFPRNLILQFHLLLKSEIEGKCYKLKKRKTLTSRRLNNIGINLRCSNSTVMRNWNFIRQIFIRPIRCVQSFCRGISPGQHHPTDPMLSWGSCEFDQTAEPRSWTNWFSTSNAEDNVAPPVVFEEAFCNWGV